MSSKVEALCRLIPVPSKGDREILLPYSSYSLVHRMSEDKWIKSGISEAWLCLVTAALLQIRVKVRVVPLHVPVAALHPLSSMSNPARICQHGEDTSWALQPSLSLLQ